MLLLAPASSSLEKGAAKLSYSRNIGYHAKRYLIGPTEKRSGTESCGCCYYNIKWLTVHLLQIGASPSMPSQRVFRWVLEIL